MPLGSTDRRAVDLDVCSHLEFVTPVDRWSKTALRTCVVVDDNTSETYRGSSTDISRQHASKAGQEREGLNRLVSC